MQNLIALLASDPCISYLASLAASVTWDSAKAGLKKVFTAPNRAGNAKLEAQFQELSSDTALRRDLELTIVDAIRAMPPNQQQLAARNIDTLGDAIHGFLWSDDDDASSLVAKIRNAAARIHGVSNIHDDAVRSVTTALLTELSGSRVLGVLLLQGQSQLQESLHQSARDQSTGMKGLSRGQQAIMDLLGTTRAELKQGLSTVQASAGSRSLVDIRPDPIGLSELVSAYANLGLAGPGATLSSPPPMAPPPLPSPIVLRPAIYEAIDARLENHPCLAITGYPECGKTITVASYASQARATCLWFSFRPEVPHPGTAIHLLCMSLRNDLGGSDHSISAITEALVQKARETPTLLVLDNVELIQNPDCLSFLQQAAERGNNRLRIILLCAETPNMTEALRLTGSSPWRLPGMESHEVAELFEKSGLGITDTRLNAIRVLCAQCDGHVGMLKLLRSKVECVTTESDVQSLLSHIPKAEDAGHFLRALVARFLDGLTTAERRLCRRLAITIGPAPRGLAEALWAIGVAEDGFDLAWQRCTAAVFETPDGTRFRLPSLYQSGLRKDIEEEEARLLDAAAAEYLIQPHAGSLRVDDATYGVIHFLAAHQLERAVEEAARLIIHARRSGHDNIAYVLCRRFELMLLPIVRAHRVSPSASIRVLVSFHGACSVTNEDQRAAAHADELRQLLEGVADDAENKALALGHITLLMHAASAGDTTLALNSLDGFLQSVAGTLNREELPSVVPVVFTAFSQAQGDPLQFVEAMLDRVCRKQISVDELWQGPDKNGDWYTLWQLVSLKAYCRGAAQGGQEPNAATDVATQLWELANRMRVVGHPAPAAILAAMAILLDIDVVRNLHRAMERADELRGHSVPDDKRVKARLLGVRADALRCSGRDEEAVVEYEAAVIAWPKENAREVAILRATLGITYGKLARYDDAIRCFRLAVRDLQDAEGSDPGELARYWLEGAVAAIHGGAAKRGLACLVLAHRVLASDARNSQMWAVLAQLAAALKSHVQGEGSSPVPLCGFSLGLPATIPGAEKMEPSAPSAMLAEACAALGQYHRAVHYTESAFFELKSDGLRRLLGASLFSNAVATKHLPTICRAAALALSADLAQLPAAGGVTAEKWLDGYVLHETISCLAASFEDGGHSLTQADDAFESIDIEANQYARIIAALIDALRTAQSEGDDSQLDAVFKLCLEAKCAHAARDVASIWCVKIFPGRASTVATVLRWQWRLVWLSRFLGSHDDRFLQGSLDQQRRLWMQLSASDDATFARIVSAVSDDEGSGVQRMQRLESAMAEVSLDVLGLQDALTEICLSASGGWLGGELKPIQQSWTSKLLDHVLSPWSPHAHDLIRETLSTAESVLGPIGDQTMDNWLSDIGRLTSIFHALCDNRGSREAAEALLHFANLRAGLSSESQANWFLALHQASTELEEADPLISRVRDAVSVESIAECLSAHEFPVQMNLRLRSVALFAKSQTAGEELRNAQLVKRMQESISIPVKDSVIATADRRLSAIRQRIAELQRDYQKLEQQLLESDADWEVIWTCQSNHACLAMTVATSDMVFINGVREGHGQSINDAIQVLRAASTLALDNENFGCAALCAARIASGYELLGEANDAAEAHRDAAVFAEKSGDPSTIEFVHKMRSAGLPTEFSHEGQPIGYPVDDAGIQAMANGVLQALGLPEDRRRHVVDDIRKQIRFVEAKSEYCRHLQPIQNLTHTSSPGTAYARPTVHVCRCELLGVQTKIETEDADTALTSMIKTYCDDCDQRNPLRAAESDDSGQASPA